MANRPALMKQRDLTGIAKAMQAAAVSDWKVKFLPGGEIVLIVGKTDAANQKSDWD